MHVSRKVCAPFPTRSFEDHIYAVIDDEIRPPPLPPPHSEGCDTSPSSYFTESPLQPPPKPLRDFSPSELSPPPMQLCDHSPHQFLHTLYLLLIYLPLKLTQIHLHSSCLLCIPFHQNSLSTALPVRTLLPPLFLKIPLTLLLIMKSPQIPVQLLQYLLHFNLAPFPQMCTWLRLRALMKVRVLLLLC